MPTKCPHCYKEYKTASRFHKHFAICHALKTAGDGDEVLSLKQLTVITRKLIKENESLKKKVQLLENRGVCKKKVNIIEWINKHLKDLKHFKNWVEKIEVNKSDLNYTLNTGFIEGVIRIILNSFNDNLDRDNIPIRCFNEIRGIYVYDEKCWRLIEDKEMKKIIALVQRKLLCEYKNVEDKMGDKIYDSSRNDKYLNDMKILLGDGKFQQNTEKIKNKIYSSIKLSGTRFVTQRFNFN